MDQTTPHPETTTANKDPEIEQSKLEQQHVNGANWFYWIAALSLVNSAIIHFGGEWSFVIGLGITQFFDAIAAVVAAEAGAGAASLALAFAIAADLAVAGAFVLFGVFARKRHTWAFVLGMLFYALDGLLFLLVGDWLSIGFHVFALIGLTGGLSASRKIVARSAPAEAPPAYEPITP
jgi:hypothetical protein